jgi:uncharacterized OsmC-like protein
MVKTSSFKYIGDLRLEVKHDRSGQIFLTDAPIDNQGKGEAISPTDMLATSLGLCMVTIMGISAQTHGFSMEGVRGEITKIMTSNPRKIIEVIVDLYFPDNGYSEKDKKIIEHISRTCPVSLSLHPDLKQTVNIVYE